MQACTAECSSDHRPASLLWAKAQAAHQPCLPSTLHVCFSSHPTCASTALACGQAFAAVSARVAYQSAPSPRHPWPRQRRCRLQRPTPGQWRCPVRCRRRSHAPQSASCSRCSGPQTLHGTEPHHQATARCASHCACAADMRTCRFLFTRGCLKAQRRHTDEGNNPL